MCRRLVWNTSNNFLEPPRVKIKGNEGCGSSSLSGSQQECRFLPSQCAPRCHQDWSISCASFPSWYRSIESVMGSFHNCCIYAWVKGPCAYLQGLYWANRSFSWTTYIHSAKNINDYDVRTCIAKASSIKCQFLSILPTTAFILPTLPRIQYICTHSSIAARPFNFSKMRAVVIFIKRIPQVPNGLWKATLCYSACSTTAYSARVCSGLCYCATLMQPYFKDCRCSMLRIF